MSDVKRYLVIIDKNHCDQLLEMSERLQAVGCQVDRIMDQLGIIGIFADSDQAKTISQIEGVTEVKSGEEQFHAI